MILGEEKTEWKQTAVIVALALGLFTWLIATDPQNEPVETEWIDEMTVCYKQGGRVINCETVYPIP